MADIARPSKRASFKRAVSSMPRVLTYMAWQSWFNYFSGDPFNAFVETMVHCPTPTPTDGRCPLGSVLDGEACKPASRQSRDWSLSDHCYDKAVVLRTVSRLNGMNSLAAATLSLLAVAIGGASIDGMGRKPVLMMALFVNVIVKALLFTAGFLPWAAFRVLLLVQNAIVVMSLAPVYPAMNAMVADISRGDEALRGDCYAALEVVSHVADMLAFVCGYPVLKRHMGDYRPFWGALTIVSFCAFTAFTFILRETRELAAKESSDGEGFGVPPETAKGWPKLRELATECTHGFCAVWAHPFLRLLLPIWAITSAGLDCTWNLSQMYAQSFMHLGQADSSMSRALWQLALTFGSALSAPLITWFGANVTMCIGLGVLCVAWGLCGTGGIFHEWISILFWSCGVGVGGVAYGMLTPCFNTILSMRVGEELQGKAFASVIITNTLIGMSISVWWPFYIFDPAAKGWQIGLMWFVSSGIFAVMLLCYVTLCVIRRRKKTHEDDASEEEWSGDTSASDEASQPGRFESPRGS